MLSVTAFLIEGMVARSRYSALIAQNPDFERENLPVFEDKKGNVIPSVANYQQSNEAARVACNQPGYQVINLNEVRH
jgi:hypothetical protein